LIWSDKDSLAMHFGYWDENTASKKEALINPYREIINLMKPKTGELLLDSGCGMGGATFWIARNTSANITGITISKKQIEIAKQLQKTTRADVSERTDFYDMDFTKTSFRNEMFHGVFGVESFSHSYPNMELVLKEMHRILKKGGKIVMIDGVLFRHAKNAQEKELLKRMYQGWKLNGGLTVLEITEQFKKAGFKRVSFIDKTDAIKRSAFYLYVIGLIGYPAVKVLNFFGVISDVVFENVLPVIHQRKLQKLGIMGHGIFYAEK
jgi:cyclopropane fatty-acyl-phospholipid synthase-like methyltransferase